MAQLKLTQTLGCSTYSQYLQLLYRNYIFYCCGSYIVMHNIETDEQEAYIHHSNASINCLAIETSHLDENSILLAVGDSERYSNITIYQITQPTKFHLNENQEEEHRVNYQVKLKLKGHRHPVEIMEFSNDSRFLISVCNRDGSMFLWDVHTGERLTQNKNTRNINAIKFCPIGLSTEETSGISITGLSKFIPNQGYNLITAGRGHCKIWPVLQPDSINVCRIQEQEHWILVGKTIPLSKKLALKEFIGIQIWNNYILLLAYDGLLCLITKTPNQQKLAKCIDLMIQKASSMQVYDNAVFCGGDNSLVKVIDLLTLTLTSKFPKPPPKKKQNISKQSQDYSSYELAENQQFPRCIGIRVSIYFSQITQSNQFLISTLYENQTIFIWKYVHNNPLQIMATASIISHQGSISQIKVLQQFPQNNLTFFATVSNADNTLRIWHVYTKFVYNRESIDLAEIIGVKRNAYCRNLTRILYLETGNPITDICEFSNIGNCKRGIACIAKNQLFMYSLDTYEIMHHETFQEHLKQIQIKGNLIYLAFEGKEIKVYQFFETLSKIRRIELEVEITKLQVTQDNKLTVIYSQESQQTILFNLGQSKIVHIEKDTTDFFIQKTHIIFMHSSQKLTYYHTQKHKVFDFISLKHQLQIDSHNQTMHKNQSHYSDHHQNIEEQKLVKLVSNELYVVSLTSYNKIIVCNFSQAVIANIQCSEKINDLEITDNNQIIAVGDCGNIMVYSIKENSTCQKMNDHMKNWIQKNDLSWMEGSIWARKKSNNQLGSSLNRKDSNKDILFNNSQSIKLTTSIKLKQQLPNVQIKYKSDRNDKSIFNPSDICHQANQIYEQMNNIINKPKATNKVEEQQQSMQEIMLTKNSQKNPLLPPKKRIFGLLNKTKDKQLSDATVKTHEQQEGSKKYGASFKQALSSNNLVTSVIHSDQLDSGVFFKPQQNVDAKKEQDKQFRFTYSQFDQNKQTELKGQGIKKSMQQQIRIAEQKQIIWRFYSLMKKYSDNPADLPNFINRNSQDLTNIHTIMQQIGCKKKKKEQIIGQFNQYMHKFRQYLQKEL